MKKFFASLVFLAISSAVMAGPRTPVPVVVKGPVCTGPNCTQAVVRDSKGQLSQSSTTNGAATTFRDASGRIIGSGNTTGGTITVRDNKGQILYTTPSR